MNGNSSSDTTYSSFPTPKLRHVNAFDVEKRTGQSRGVPPNPQTVCKSHPYKKPAKPTAISSYESHSSFSSNISKPSSSNLKIQDSEKIHQRIEEHYTALQIIEAKYYYYIEDRSDIVRADKLLEQAPNGTYFVRKAEDAEQISQIKYFLHFVCHKNIGSIPICYDEERRTYWFLSGCGIGSEVQREYTGVDLLIQNKTENIFHELQYPFKISLYRPIDRTLAKCIPLPDEARILARQNTILHEIATQGLSNNFNELIRISKDGNHELRDKAKFILNKINGRNQQGQTPLILAIQAKKYEFVELLLDNNVDINMTDAQGCSPLQHACRQANHKLLKKLINRKADPHYCNRKETTDDTHQSNLSAFHYLAMAKGATAKNITQCVRHLLECKCPLMPLTKEGKSPFDIAEMYQNSAYESIKIFCNRYEFNGLLPIEVSSRNDAKTMLSDLACPSVLGKIRLRFKQCDNRECVRNDGLFLLYKTRKTRSQPNEEYGICVHYGGQVFTYIISRKHKSIIINPSNTAWETVYDYSLITDTVKDDYAQVILFNTCEELIYNHTEYKGILPTVLKDFVRKDNGELTTMNATELLLPNNKLSMLFDVDDTKSGDDYSDDEIDVESIDRFDLSQIHSAKLIDENQRRLIWLAKVQYDQMKSFPIVIKDYLPDKDIDLYKQYRLNEFSSLPRYRSNTTEERPRYEFSSRTRVEYKHESKLLLKQLKNHPFIVHAFICDHRPKRDLRIFMEYLPHGNLHTYLRQLESDSQDSLINAFHWIYQLAQVMAYLSHQKIVHRDLAVRNILLKNEKYIKLSDFGLSRLEGVELEGKDCIIPSRWVAPECFDRHATISSSSDIWSFGIVIWEIYSFGATPYEAETGNSSQPLVPLLKRFLIEQNRRLSRPDYCPESVYDLMYRCWNGNVSRRPRFVDIINEFNGTSIVKEDRIVPFTREEKKAWRRAKDEYFSINQSARNLSNIDPEYVEVEDNENDPTDAGVASEI